MHMSESTGWRVQEPELCSYFKDTAIGIQHPPPLIRHYSPMKSTIQFLLVQYFQLLLGRIKLHESGQTSQKVFHTPDIWLNSFEMWSKSRTWLNISHHCFLGDIPHEKPGLAGKVISSSMPCSWMHPVDNLVNRYLSCLDWTCYELNVSVPPTNSYVHILTPKVMVLGGEAFGMCLGSERGNLMNRTSALRVFSMKAPCPSTMCGQMRSVWPEDSLHLPVLAPWTPTFNLQSCEQ